MINYEKNVIVTKSIAFSLMIMKYCDLLYQDRRFVIANQLLRSSTSIGANVVEAQHAESAADFLHKMKIASKEANETYYGLILCKNSEEYGFDQKYEGKLEQLIRIISKIIISCKKKRRKLENYKI
jgi:four helix bundle protein